MMRPAWKVLIVIAVLFGTIAVGATQADAWWWRHGYWGYGYGPYWSSWDCGYGCGYGYGWGWGGYRHFGWRARHCGWYNCGYSCDPCWGGGYAVGYVGAVGCCDPIVTGAPIAAPAQSPTPAPPPATKVTPPPPPPSAAPSLPSPSPSTFNPAPASTPLPGTTQLNGTSGTLTIWVPEDAKVFVNGYQTRSTGTQRRYISNGLTSGMTYKYEIRAQVVRDGKTLEETRQILLTAGAREALAFNFAPAQRPAAELAATW